MTAPIDPALVARFAPTGTLRASINVGNPLLAGRDVAGTPIGVSIDLAHAFATHLGLACDLVVFENARDSVEAVEAERADIGFFAIDPKRGAHIAFTAPYVLIEGAYLVRAASTIHANDEVDQPGRRIVVGEGSAYDLYLTRELRHAKIERVASSGGVVDAYVAGDADVAAGIRQALEADAQRIPGLRLLDGRFMVIQQAMGVAKSRGAQAQVELAAFVEAMKAKGFVDEALARHAVRGASVAPAG